MPREIQMVEAQRVKFLSRGGIGLLRELGWGHLCDILAKTLAALCSSSENPSEAEFKSNRLISLLGEA